MANDRAAKLPKGRTLAEFQPLKPIERILLDQAAAGTMTFVGVPEGEQAMDQCDLSSIARPRKPTNENTVRASFIRFLALGGDADSPVHEKGLWLCGAWIDGVLDLECVESKGSVVLVHSTFAETPILRDARIKGALVLSGSEVPGLQADRLACDAGLFLAEAFTATKEVRLLGAKIGSDLACGGSTFGGQDIEGRGLVALSADGAEINGNVFLGHEFLATGAVRLLGAKIQRNLECSGGTFKNPHKDALSADGVEIGGAVFLKAPFKADGEVRLLGAKIRGNLECSGGEFENQDRAALSADGAQISGNVYMDAGFRATGEVRLLGAKVAGNLQCSGGAFKNDRTFALSADQVAVGNSVFMDNGFDARGEVRLLGARISSDLVMNGGRFGGAGVTINLQGALIGQALIINKVKIVGGALNVASATVSTLADSATSWPDIVMLDGFVYGGLAAQSPVEASIRIGWLDRQAAIRSEKNSETILQFRPQPWQQLRKVLREMGHYEAAREVGIGLERRKRRYGLVGQTPKTASWWCPVILWPIARGVYWVTANFLHVGYGGLVDYGYRPLRLLFIAAFVCLACFGVYHEGKARGVFAPTSPAIYAANALRACADPPNGKMHWERCSTLPAEYPRLNSLVYSLNVLLPVGDLGQESAWRPMTTTRFGWWIQVLVWFETLFGWVASLILIAVVSGLAKRDE